MSMDQEIKSAIEKNLPSAVGDVLKLRLEQAERDQASLGSLRTEFDAACTRFKKAEEINSELREKLRNFDVREADVAKREKEIQRLELIAQFEKEKADLVRSMFSIVFQNRTVRENALVQRERFEREDYAGGGGHTNRYPVEVKETKDIEET